MDTGNGHFSGRIKGMIDKATEEVKGKTKEFYSIMKRHGFYDVDDPDNKLADWQRAAVPEYNQHRMSDLCDAIAEMLADYLGNQEYGVLAPGLEGIVNKLDQRAAMTAAEVDTVGAAVGGFTGGASEATRQALSNLVASVMGGCKFDPDVVPPISIGFNGLPISFANAFKKGTYPPDWTFLYDHEIKKSNKPYKSDNGYCSIGAGIRLDTGGEFKLLVLKMVFSVPDVDENGMPIGDAVNGLTAEQFETLRQIADKQYDELTDDEKNFELTEGQLQTAYFKYIQLILWGAIKNDNNWAYLHWGCLTHNSCPEAIKTAVCSYLQTNGLAVDVNNCPIAGTISYCVNTGMAYLTGAKKPIGLLMIPGIKYIAADGTVKTVSSSDADGSTERKAKWSTENKGVPKDEKLANLHFVIVADILAHLTYDTSPNPKEMRKRRIDEANKIYSHCGYSTIPFGSALTPASAQYAALKKRNFDYYVESTIQVYENKNIVIPVDPSNIKILNWAEKGSNEMSELTMGTIRYIATKAGLPGVVVTSVFRSPEAQARAMFNNRQSHGGQIAVNYAPRGREVDAAYTKVSKEVNNGQCLAIKDAAAQQRAKSEMQRVCQKYYDAGTPVSNHGNDPSKIQAVDMGPNSMRKAFKFTEEQLKRFHVACYDTYKAGLIKQYIGPQEYGGPKVKDPAFHIEVWQDSSHKHPPGVSAGEASYADTALLPSVKCVVDDANLINENAWDLVFIHDQNY